MLRVWACLAVCLPVLLLLSPGAYGIQVVAPTGTAAASSTPFVPVAPETSSSGVATLTIASVSQAKSLPLSFWGVNVVAHYPFGAPDAAKVSATPATFLQFPGGVLGEEFNYTSGVVTNPNGVQYTADTSTKAFIASCETIHCHAILQLPTEIDQPTTAAYFAAYVVHTLGYQPAYWEIGNDPSAWTHLGVPWSEWKTKDTGNITPLPFANLVHTYIAAVLKVDPAAKFLALGVGMGIANYAESWVKQLAIVDGHDLSGISVHSYILGHAPAKPTWAQLLANLNGPYSLPAQVTADRGFIKAACPSCTNLDVFVTEANAAETNNYTALDSTFAGTLYIAADTAQALDLRLTSLDWYCYDCNFSGSWETSVGHFGLQYTLMSRMMPMLGSETLATTVTGLSTFYAAATYDSSGLALLVVNTNLTRTATFSLSHTGILPGSSAQRELWTDGSGTPSHTTIKLGKSVSVPALTIEILKVGPKGVVGGSTPSSTLPGMSSRGGGSYSIGRMNPARAAVKTSSAARVPSPWFDGTTRSQPPSVTLLQSSRP
jgi:hypothetical protein